MTVSIIGWYGTETQGDIAILDGILAILSQLDNSITVNLGSLFRFYTERTLLLNRDIFKINSPNVDIYVFDIKDKNERKKNILESDLVLIGGGPLDNIREIVLLENCFKMANKRGIPAIIFGCGIDHLTDLKCIQSLKSISTISKLILVRDENTKNKFLNIFEEIQNKIYVIQDPAILSILNYKFGRTTIKKNNSISINFRRYTSNEYGAPIYYSEYDFVKFIETLASHYENIRLVPMHTFFYGEDDRYYMSKLKQQITNNNVTVVHKPQNLYELYDLFQSSFGCVGMRYHSIVIQTILNGNNLIFDYTNPKDGKIIGFLHDNNIIQSYKDRICHLQDQNTIDLRNFSNRFNTNLHHIDIHYDSACVINFIKKVL